MTDRSLPLRYWGKANPAQNSTGPVYHPLPYHSLDVAAVIWQLLAPEKTLCQQLSASLQVSPGWLQSWFSYCAALHDLGKFSSAFQGLVTEISSDLISPDATKSYRGVRHDSLGLLLWDQRLKKALWQQEWEGLGFWRMSKELYRALNPWLQVVTGHHGEPPKSLQLLSDYYTEQDAQAGLEFTAEVYRLLQPELSPLADKQLAARLKVVSWQLAGLMVLADWSGSDQARFPYMDQPMPLAEYWDTIALPSAIRAVDRMKPERIAAKPFVSVQALFPHISQPTPLQAQAAAVEIPKEPQLWILEDVTGAGKTEAALTLVSRMMTKGLAEGVYIGLPTMATANGMYDRMADSYRHLFDADSLPSLVLAHGARELSERFEDSKRLSSQQADSSYGDELSATAYCNSWVADHRKKSLFADVGVGTIDQALLAILPARHQSLRLLGLRDKVLLVDEVHAYDSYMRRLLCALLEAHAAQGGSAIMLSATLPQSMRSDYLNAYRDGRGQRAYASETLSADYPLITHLTDTVCEYPVASRASVSRSLRVQPLDSVGAVAQRVCSAIAQGQSVCWIRNTVADAREAYQVALEHGWAAPEKTTLFHSRFAMCDRQVIEADVLSRFGKSSCAVARSGQLLIATQVVEQSLDLDFDLMVTDLAPIDLLIQRAGRLHRHCRDATGNPSETEQRPSPVLCIHAPPATEDVNDQWLLPNWCGSQAVYRNIGQLWLTLRALEKQHWTLTMPGAARELIEAVYDPDAQLQIPDALLAASLEAEGEEWAKSGQAKTNQLNLNKGYCRESSASLLWDADSKTPTRLSDDTVTVVLLREQEGVLLPWSDAKRSPWALSQITLREKDWRTASGQITPDQQLRLDQLKESTDALRWVELLPLVGDLAGHYSAEGGWDSDRN